MNQFYGSIFLLKIKLRRNFLKIAIWLFSLSVIFIEIAVKINSIYNTHHINGAKAILNSPTMLILIGSSITKNLTAANVFVTEVLIVLAVLIAVMNINLAIGNNKYIENSNLRELLIGGTSVGRLAPLAATGLLLILVNVFLSSLSYVEMSFINLEGSSHIGNLLFALSIGTYGLLVGCFSTFVYQLVTYNRTAYVISYSFLGFQYLLRMIIDVKKIKLQGISSLNWLEAVSVFNKNNWNVLLMIFILAFAIYLLAVLLASISDLNNGIIQIKSGKTFSKHLKGPFSLLIRNERIASLSWIVGMFIMGCVYGFMISRFNQNANQTQIIYYLMTISIIFAMLTIIASNMVINNLFLDEQIGYLQMLITKPIKRYDLLGIYVGYAIVLAVSMFWVSLKGTALVSRLFLKYPLPNQIFNNLFYNLLPIIILFISIETFVIGRIPKYRFINWVLLGLTILITYISQLMQTPQNILYFSPFEWAKRGELANFNGSSVLFYTGVFLLFVLGFVNYSKRDFKN